jgi:polysaccharide export outer membrane protein
MRNVSFQSVVLFQCTLPSTLADTDITAEKQISEEYQIGPEDVLEVLVWKNEALSKVVTVRPDGRISYRSSAISKLEGSPRPKSKMRLPKNSGSTIRNPRKSPSSFSKLIAMLYILGEVQRPGQYVVKHGTTFLQAIALAGGLTPCIRK